MHMYLKSQPPKSSGGGLGGRGNPEEEGIDLLACMGNSSKGYDSRRQPGLRANDACANRDEDDML